MRHSTFFYRCQLSVVGLFCLLAELAWADSAQQAFWQGHYGQAAKLWQTQLESIQVPEQQVKLRVQIATAQRHLGAYSSAEAQLEAARALLSATEPSQAAAEFYNEYSKLLLAKGSKYWSESRAALDTAFQQAKQLQQPTLQAELLNQQGNLQGLLLDYEGALDSYAQALQLLPATESELRHKIQINQIHKIYLLEADSADLATDAEHAYPDTRKALLQQLNAMGNWQDSYAQIMGIISLVQLSQSLNQLLKPADRALEQAAWQALQQALQLAQRIQQPSALSYVFNALADLYQAHEQLPEALDYNRQAVFAAQQAQDSKLLYLNYYQQGRLFKQVGQLASAISAYQNAADRLTPIRLRDAQTGYCNVHESFRERIAPVYFELADLLLQQAAQTQDTTHKKHLLEHARSSIESFKGAELQEYYQDDCITLNTPDALVDKHLDAHTAVLYPITLTDRLELLLSFKDHIYQATVPVSRQTLSSSIALLLSPLRSNPYAEQARSRERQRGVSRGVSRGENAPEASAVCSPAPPPDISLPVAALAFQAPAQQLYQWLIAPIQAQLEKQGVGTLIIAPDGVLRTIPFAALYDGKHFLIEDYALAVIPSLVLSHLQKSQPISTTSQGLLLAGLSEARLGFSAIPCAEYEISSLHKLFQSARQPLLNQDFLQANLQQRLSDTDFRFVHIATHGQFNANLDKTFILAYDAPVSLDALEKLMKLSKVRKQPIELLTLSACETAAGDDRAALGLAGVALKSGVNSALASLWQVDDEATPAIILEFYRQLAEHPEHSKAQALQQAQTSLLHQKAFTAYRHPYFWAAFMLIGNWL